MIILLTVPPGRTNAARVRLLATLAAHLTSSRVQTHVRSTAAPSRLLSTLSSGKSARPSTSFSGTPAVIYMATYPTNVTRACVTTRCLRGTKHGLNMGICIRGRNTGNVRKHLATSRLGDTATYVFTTRITVGRDRHFGNVPTLSIHITRPVHRTRTLVRRTLALGHDSRAHAMRRSARPIGDIGARLGRTLLDKVSFTMPLVITKNAILTITMLLSRVFKLRSLFGRRGS